MNDERRGDETREHNPIIHNFEKHALSAALAWIMDAYKTRDDRRNKLNPAPNATPSGRPMPARPQGLECAFPFPGKCRLESDASMGAMWPESPTAHGGAKFLPSTASNTFKGRHDAKCTGTVGPAHNLRKGNITHTGEGSQDEKAPGTRGAPRPPPPGPPRGPRGRPSPGAPGTPPGAPGPPAAPGPPGSPRGAPGMKHPNHPGPFTSLHNICNSQCTGNVGPAHNLRKGNITHTGEGS